MEVIFKDIKLLTSITFLAILGILGLCADAITGPESFVSFGPDRVSRNTLAYSAPGATEIEDDGTLKTHWLGTDQLGRDVLARLIHGISIALRVGIMSTLISLLIALVLGGLSGYYGDQSHRVNIAQLVLFVIGVVVIHYYALEWSYFEDDRGLYVMSHHWLVIYDMVGVIILLMVLRYITWFGFREVWIPWDTIVVKLMEVFRSIPRLFLLLAIFSIISTPTVMTVVLVIGLIRWPGLTRIMRVEVMAQRQDSFVKNAQILGLSDAIIFVRHIMPNIYRPMIVLVALNMGTAILIESSLSFLHIGLPIDKVSWGRMLSDGRQYIPAWWLALGPGSLIFLSILSFNTIGDRLSYHLKVDKKGL